MDSSINLDIGNLERKRTGYNIMPRNCQRSHEVIDGIVSQFRQWDLCACQYLDEKNKTKPIGMRNVGRCFTYDCLSKIF